MSGKLDRKRKETSDMAVIPDIPRIKAFWERRTDRLPYLIVPMSDGTDIRYFPEIQMPDYQAKDDKDMVVGYRSKIFKGGLE